MPDEPLLFLKAPSAVIATGDAIELPPQSQQVEHEGELGVVIGRTRENSRADDDPLELCSRLHLRQRCHRARSATQGCAVYARQIFRHLLSGRSLIVTDLDPLNVAGDDARQRRSKTKRQHC